MKHRLVTVLLSLLVALGPYAAKAQSTKLKGPVLLGVSPGARVEVPAQLFEGKPYLLLVLPIPFEKCPAAIPSYNAIPQNFYQELRLKRRDPRACLRHAFLAHYWSTKYKRISVKLLDPRSGDEVAVQRLQLIGLGTKALIKDPIKSALRDQLAINRAPAAFLISPDGQILDKRLGFGLSLWPQYEKQLDRLERGDVAAFKRHAMKELVEGAAVEYWPPGVQREEYTFIVHLLPGCAPCAVLGEQIVGLTRPFLEKHRNIAVNVFVPDLMDEDAVCKSIHEWTSRVGAQASPATICPGQGSMPRSRDLVVGELPKRMTVTIYKPGSANDIQQHWGVIHGPSYVLIHNNRVVLRYPYTPLIPLTRVEGKQRDYGMMFRNLEAYLGR